MIITNKDAAMKATLILVIPNTFHRLWKWHFTNKMGDKIGNVYRNKKAMFGFYDFLNNSLSVLDF